MNLPILGASSIALTGTGLWISLGLALIALGLCWLMVMKMDAALRRGRPLAPQRVTLRAWESLAVARRNRARLSPPMRGPPGPRPERGGDPDPSRCGPTGPASS